MYGGSGKVGRGGGGGRGGHGHGPNKRNIHSTFCAPLHRPSAAPAGRLSLGGAPRDRSGSGTSTSAAEETFSVVLGNSLNFAMIIRLTPHIMEEIKRVESQGGSARIKFDDNANNPSGNVIEVGGKEFKFTWSKEKEDHCYVYEERQGGVDGNGLLVESGCAYRKLNLQRELDESTKNHVKMRSEEAERKNKSRKAIVLEHGSPSMKSQVKALQAAEVNPRRMHFNQKKEPPSKKQRTEPPPAGGPCRPVYKPGLSSTSKSKPSASPQSSPLEQSGIPSSPILTGNLSKSHGSGEDIIRNQVKENARASEKELPSRVDRRIVRDKPGRKTSLGDKPTDLRSILISLLKENPKGMSLKALEKTVGGIIPNSVKQIEPIIKKIATFQAPGRYLLKPGVELEGFGKHSSESGSSPEDNHIQVPPVDKRDQISVAEPTIVVEAHNREVEKHEHLVSKDDVSKALDKEDVLHQLPDLYGEKKGSDNSEEPAGSSSDSGSDSDSESDTSGSESDSGSHSRSRSKSPMESVSGSSSDSESDASSSGKEVSDEDVDIISDDEKESKHELQVPEPGLIISPIPSRTPDDNYVQNGIGEKQEDNSSDIIEIEKDSPFGNEEGEVAAISNLHSNRGSEEAIGQIKHPSPEYQERQGIKPSLSNLHTEKENLVKGNLKHGHSDNSLDVSRAKTKRGVDGMFSDDNTQNSKKFRAANSSEPQAYGGRNTPFSEHSHKLSSDKHFENPTEAHAIPLENKIAGDETELSLQKGFNQVTFGNLFSTSQQSAERSIDLSGHQANAPASVGWPGKHAENLSHGVKFSEKNFKKHDEFPGQKDKDNREMQVEDSYTDDRRPPRSFKNSGVGDRQTTTSGSSYRKHGESVRKYNDTGLVPNSLAWSSPKNNKTGLDRSPIVNGQGHVLQRELSDLELGELREPDPDGTHGAKKQFEKSSSFKCSENKMTSSDYWNFDTNKGKVSGKTWEPKKPSPLQPNVGISDDLEAMNKKRTPNQHHEDLMRPILRTAQSQSQNLTRADNVDPGVQFNKILELSSKSTTNQVGLIHGIDLEKHDDTHKMVPIGSSQQQDINRLVVPHSSKEKKRQKSNMSADLNGRRKETSLTESNDSGQKRKESSPDENSLSYSKYEKEEPELKGPIKNFPQYKEYVQEYLEKYDSYCSLNTILESYRSEFKKLGKDLESAKARDTEKYLILLGQLKESYRQCGMRHKRLKKIFIVLHEELKQLKQMIAEFAVSLKKE